MASTTIGFWFIFLIIVTIVFASSVDSATGVDDSTTAILDEIFGSYDKRFRPSNRIKPVEVSTTIYVLDLFNIDEVKHEFTVNMYFRHHWEDPRLKFTALKNMDKILLDAEHAKKLWIPDTFMPNERKSVTHSLSTPQEIIRISPNGRVLRSTRLSITASCRMNLGYFPFDNQLCSLDIESYGYSANDVVYSWKEGQESVGVSKEVSSLKYRVTGVNTKTVMISLDSGNYSRLGLEFFMVRNAARYMQDSYFPSIALTILSIFTLFMGSLIARLQISTLLMGFMIIFMSLNSTWMPRVSYQTALDLYIFICANIVFNVVIVNFILHMYHKPSSKRRDMRMRRLDESCNGGNDDNMKDILCDNDTEDNSEPNLNTKVDEIIYRIAKRSKYSIPIAFLVINVIYWMVVLIGSSGFPEDFILVENRD